jgi:hypothetical protein
MRSANSCNIATRVSTQKHAFEKPSVHAYIMRFLLAAQTNMDSATKGGVEDVLGMYLRTVYELIKKILETEWQLLITIKPCAPLEPSIK